MAWQFEIPFASCPKCPLFLGGNAAIEKLIFSRFHTQTCSKRLSPNHFGAIPPIQIMVWVTCRVRNSLGAGGHVSSFSISLCGNKMKENISFLHISHWLKQINKSKKIHRKEVPPKNLADLAASTRVSFETIGCKTIKTTPLSVALKVRVLHTWSRGFKLRQDKGGWLDIHARWPYYFTVVRI